MDRLQRFVEGSQFAVAVLLNASHTDCELVNLRPFTTRQNLDEEIASRNLHCVGVIGIVDGHPKHEFTEPLSASTLAGLSRAFIAYFEVLLSDAQQKSDFEAFMTDLCSLEDPRS